MSTACRLAAKRQFAVRVFLHKSLLKIEVWGSSLFKHKSRAGTLKERRNKRVLGRKPIPMQLIFLTAKYGGNYNAYRSSASYYLIQLKALGPLRN